MPIEDTDIYDNSVALEALQLREEKLISELKRYENKFKSINQKFDELTKVKEKDQVQISTQTDTSAIRT